jgi:outer membrane protein
VSLRLKFQAHPQPGKTAVNAFLIVKAYTYFTCVFSLSCRRKQKSIMKNISIALNVLLLIAVGVLYAKVFSGKADKAVEKKVVAANTTSAATSAASIAYIDMDSLHEKISYIKNIRAELENDQRSIETKWQNGYRSLENQKNAFIKSKGNSITQQDAEKFQGELMQQQQAIDGEKQDATQKLSAKSYKFMDDIQKKLKDFLAEYNKDKNFQYILTTGTGLDYMVYKDSALNITNDVIDGMNEKLNAKK